MDNWFVGVCLLFGLYWISESISNAADEITERLDQFLTPEED
jgi:hypothetical protein